MRNLRSKKLRNALWIAAGGKCQTCGCDLPDNWHADHVVPWSISNRTNVHEMQALCPKCNLRKGDGVAVQPRKHQREGEEVLRAIGARLRKIPKRLIFSVTPGGGKSLLPMLAARECIPAIAQRMCWVVPRINLATQAEEDYGKYAQPLNLPGAIRWADNTPNPSRGLTGYVTTYQSISSSVDLHRNEFDLRKYVLVLDEFHHCEVGETWAKAIAPLVARAALVVLMTGTLERATRKPIAFIDYLANGEPDMRQSDEQIVIDYTRGEAIKEDAIVPIDFQHIDAKAEWVDRDGTSRSRSTFNDASNEDARSMLFTALNTGYAAELLRQCVNHWLEFRKQNPWAQLLIVSHGKNAAKRDARVASEIIGQPVTVATDDESGKAHEDIKSFCRGTFKAIATVMMAYEGMNAPAVSHVACLTSIRSKPWIEQMIGRAVRKFHDKNVGWIFCPNDPQMNVIIDQIRDEQIIAIEEQDAALKRPYRQLAADGGEQLPPIVPQHSEATTVRGTALDGSADITAGQMAWLKSHGLDRHPLAVVTEFARSMCPGGSIPSVSAWPMFPEPVLSTPSEREDELRKRIEQKCREVDGERFGRKWGTTNQIVIRKFNKPRSEMTEKELKNVWTFLCNNFSQVMQ